MGRDKSAAHFMQKNSGEEQSKGPRRLGQNEVRGTDIYRRP